MNSALPYEAASRSGEWERDIGARRLSSPRGLLPSPPVPRRPSAPPGLLPPLQTQRLSSSLCSSASLPGPARRAPGPCRWPLGVMALLRLSLLLFSCLFWAAGLAIFTLGVWTQVSLSDYMLLSANSYPNAPLALLATGGAITAWGFLGCLGTAARLPCLLRAYGFFQLFTLVAGLAAGLSGLFYREDIAEGFRSGLQRAVADYGEDEGRANALDGLQRALKCCGAEGWEDWLESDWTPLGPAGNESRISVPDSCCARRRDCRNRPVPERGEEAGIHRHGCFRKVFGVVNDNVFHIAATVLGLAFTQVAGISLACLLANRLPPRAGPGGGL
ncbi:tetraspanin-7-like [Conger conger]|uniref:tetraspanin-7-like n=1 Tax=Conger conger TaxID=82655 RepID=UPI002A5A69C7|nr:tetraspanin-7-like [Conger conger]